MMYLPKYEQMLRFSHLVYRATVCISFPLHLRCALRKSLSCCLQDPCVLLRQRGQRRFCSFPKTPQQEASAIPREAGTARVHVEVAPDTGKCQLGNDDASR
jgi:hypothetical protein